MRPRSLLRRLLVALSVAALVGGGAGVAGAAPVPDGVYGPRIVGGTTSPANAWPVQAALLARSTPDPTQAQFCGGTLVAARWVLTASHCVRDLTGPGQVQVAVGIQRLSDIRARDRVAVTQIVMHPGFRFDDSWRAGKNDVALLRLDRALPGPYAALVGPAQDGAWGVGTTATVVGWGTTTPNGTQWPNALRQVDVPVISDAACQRVYPELDPASAICAGWPNGGRDACQGDSGGPLWVPVRGVWRQVGVVSGGEGCAQAGYPGAYADVRGLNSWITARITT